MYFLIQMIVNGVAIWLTSLLLGGISMDLPPNTFQAILYVAVVALVFTLVTFWIKPVVKVLSIPLLILTLGLFFFVINALMLMLTSWLTGLLGFGLVVDGFWWALGGSIVISIVSALINGLLPGPQPPVRG